MTVQQVYDTVCAAMLEPGGFVLGVYSEAQFLHTLAIVLLDFSQRAPLDKTIFTTMISAAQAEYLVPDDVMRPELLFVNARLIERVSEAELGRSRYQWKNKTGPPEQWYEDSVDLKHVGLTPVPDYNGANIPGVDAPVGEYGDFFPGEKNLTMVGPGAPSQTAWALGDTIDGLPDSFALYLAYGVLAQIFADESETRDLQRAFYCKTRFDEGISLAKALAKEELLEEDDD